MTDVYEYLIKMLTLKIITLETVFAIFYYVKWYTIKIKYIYYIYFILVKGSIFTCLSVIMQG